MADSIDGGMSQQRWERTHTYIDHLFSDDADRWSREHEASLDAGLPAISVGATVGRWLTLLTAVCRDGGSKLVVEVGTLGGASALALAGGLAADGKLITIEANPDHVEFARAAIQRSGETRIDVRQGEGLTLLPELVEELGQGSCDLLFLDAIKTEYPGYLDAGLPLLRSGGLIVADNVLGAGDGWIPDSIDDEPSRVAIDQFNRRVSDHPRLQGTILPMRQGLLVARVL
ncbi:MAG: O-methyltransferase [Bacillota bacterium]|nr:MAG: O-methyltransferase [Planctomycetota bacterium]RUA09979.1 MAG: O-methyltransferase [Bacillota bacterium]